MNLNLVLVAGLGYTCIGALIMVISYRALYRRASRIVAGYPRVLAALRAQKNDARFGVTVLICGNVLQVLAACGYTLPFEHWRYPAYAAAALFVVYGLWRFTGSRRLRRGEVQSAAVAASPMTRVYETRRSMVLLEAARREAANRRIREQQTGPRDHRVIYIGYEWDCRWWSDKFGVTPDTLRAAVRQVGPMVVDIERYFALKSAAPYAIAA